jgi:hypothetical protein
VPHLADWRAAGLSVPAILRPDGPVAERGAGDQVEPVGLGDVVEQPATLARNVGVQVQAELVDQVEPHERPPEANAAQTTIGMIPPTEHEQPTTLPSRSRCSPFETGRKPVTVQVSSTQLATDPAQGTRGRGRKFRTRISILPHCG